MTFDELLAKVRAKAEGVDVSDSGFLAVQVNITGKNEGVFYVEVKDHRINIEPYEYIDRNCALTMNMTDFNKLIDGKLDPILAFTTGKLKVEGDAGKALEFSKILRKR
ncbi:MAG: SCP2 sterol-binding domain-containing protein [Lachnospiraceae bacterium]|nr:SCP2 sterol-binding domain-containing protein [Lachnospiraceae bacterium]